MLYENGVMTETLVMERLEELESKGRIHWPSISEKEIEDKSKGDVFSKGFAVLQTTYFITQCIARGVYGLGITELEFATLAFAVLNGVLYFLWWNKPLDVACPVPVDLLSSRREAGVQTMESHYRETRDHELPQIFSGSFDAKDLALGPEDNFNHKDDISATKKMEPSPIELHSSTSFQHLSAIVCYHGNFKDMVLFPFRIFWLPLDRMANCESVTVDVAPLSVPTFYAPPTPGKDDLPLMIGMIVGGLFGGIHSIAWSIGFPSVEEKYVWRTSAIAITTIPLCLFSFVGFLFSVSSIVRRINTHLGYNVLLFPTYIAKCTTYFFVVVYFVSRAALLVLPLLALRSLPPQSLLDIRWSSFIPHI